MDERLTDIEVKLAYLEKAHGELDAVVRGLADAVAGLRRELTRLRAEQGRDVPEPRDEKPPHY